MMYILKATDPSGYYYLIESPTITLLSSNIYRVKYHIDNTYTVSVMTSFDESTTRPNVIKFNSAIDEINKTERFQLLHGRFRVSKYLSDHRYSYVLHVYCKASDRHLIGVTRNVITRLYRMCRNDEAPREFLEDLNEYGNESMSVHIYGPYVDRDLTEASRQVYRDIGFSGSSDDDTSLLYKLGNYKRSFMVCKDPKVRKHYLNYKISDKDT